MAAFESPSRGWVTKEATTACVDGFVLIASGNNLERHILARTVQSVLPGLAPVHVTGLHDSPQSPVAGRFELALLALNLSDCDGLDWLEVVGRRTQINRVLVIGQTFPEIAASRLATGVADGFWDYRVDSPDNLDHAVNEISCGGGYMSYGLSELRRRSLQGRPSLRTILSRTEILVFYAIAGGEDDVAAAALLGMTAATVKTHRKSISRKLKLSTRTELMREAQFRGIVRFAENGLVIRPGFFAAMNEHLERRQARSKTDETVGAS